MIQDDEAIYGEVFKEIRESKCIKAKDAFIGACSIKTLYNFENGVSCVNIVTLLKLLKNINTSEEDYFDAIRDYQSDITDKFFQNIISYHVEGNVTMLKKIFTELKPLKKEEDKLRLLMVGTIINDLDRSFTISKEDLMNASGYLMGVEKWGYNELGLFAYVADILSVDLSTSIMKELIKKNNYGDEKRKTRIIRALLNTSYSCIKHGRLQDTNNFLQKAQFLIKTKKIFDVLGEAFVLQFMQGFYLLIKGEQFQGKQLMKEAIERIKSTKDKGLISQYENYYDEALAQAQELFGESKVNDQKVDFRKVIKF